MRVENLFKRNTCVGVIMLPDSIFPAPRAGVSPKLKGFRRSTALLTQLGYMTSSVVLSSKSTGQRSGTIPAGYVCKEKRCIEYVLVKGIERSAGLRAHWDTCLPLSSLLQLSKARHLRNILFVICVVHSDDYRSEKWHQSKQKKMAGRAG